jgi:threonine dehydratase
VPPQDKPAFQIFLDKLGYAYWDESKNPAYTLFLG